MATTESEPVQLEQDTKEDSIDIITYRPTRMWSVVEWWNSSYGWQIFNHGTTDALRYILGKHYVVGWRRSFDPYVHNSKELYSPPKIDPTPPPTQLPNYKYHKLASAEHIRLVHILHGAEDSPLSIRFTTAALAEVPLFETLSYVWGVKRHYRVNCEGTSLIVRQNLYDALQALRSTDEVRIFWIDALSIDQDNLKERVQQVEMMREIYAASQRTVIWLGARDAASLEAVALLKKLANVPKSTEAEIPFDEDESTWKELGVLYDNPWFYRVWIIQEVAVAKSVVIMLNKAEIWEWDMFAEASKVALHRCKAWQAVFDPNSFVWLDGIRAEYLTGGPCPNLFRALSYGRRALATLDVDKIYAVLGLSEETFKVDYEESAVDTYIRLAAHFMAHSMGIALLDHVEDHAFRLRSELPSWIPDWEVRQGAQILKSLPYCGQWNASVDADAYARLSAEGRHLHVRGFVVDTLDHIGDLFIEQVPISGTPRKIPHNTFHGWFLQQRKPFVQLWALRRVKQWYFLAMKFAKLYNNEEKRYEAYLYTITAGCSIIDLEYLAYLKNSYSLWCKVWLAAAANEFSNAISAYGQHPVREMNEAMNFMQMHVMAAWGRRLFTSRQHGAMGLCPALSRKGDKLVIIHGVTTPCILRLRRNGRYRFVGPCYAHGLMHGEAKEIADHNKVEDFELV